MSTGDDDRTTALPAGNGGAGADAPGERIGPYRLVRLLGEGGMGQVHLAEQSEPIRRKVALKLIRRQLAGPLARAYFEVERQALARMEHPAIARVFDAGQTDEGYPWFAMEHVEGRPLDVWVRETQPTLASRLRVLIALAFGVQHAHQRGIVHRDLKPSNVLVCQVDGRPQPRLIDFGIATGIDGEGGGTSYERVGSGAYMSPEQFAGDAAAIDIRTDIYSLGVVLLTCLLPQGRLDALGEPVPQREALHERLLASLQRRGQDPVLDALPWELRHVVARACHPQRERRYHAATALAEDLQRFLDGYPVSAVPEGRGYRLRKFIRRRRRPLALAAVAAVALVGGLAVALWGLVEAERQARRSQATADFLATVLSGIDPDQARDLDKTLLRTVVDQAAQRAEVELADQPEALAEIESVIAESYTGLGEFDLAVQFNRRAYERNLARFGPDSLRTLASARAFGRSRSDSGEFQGTEAFLRDTLERLHRTVGDDHLVSLRTRQSLGWLMRETTRYEEALVELTRTLEGLRSSRGEDDADTLETRLTRAIVLSDLERFDEAIAELQALSAIRTRLLGADHPRTLSVRNSLAVAYLQSRRFAEGEQVLLPLLADHERVYGPDSTSTLMVVGNLGGALRQQGKVAESGPYYRRAAEAMRDRFGPAHPRTLMSLHNYGNYLLDAGEAQQAWQAQTDVIDHAAATFGGRHQVIAEALTTRGRALVRLRRLTEAESDLQAALAMKTELLGADHGRLESTRTGMAELQAARDPAGAAAAAVP
ncbi:MAG: serine/threonine protein kinase [Xanthomonadales bacterium]|nr:serine/threonine protein kinase [Xanthomonadales bacterium]